MSDLAITTWPSLHEPRGRLVRTTWGAFEERARSPRVVGVQKRELARWAPARFVDDYRRLANVIDLGAIVADVDIDTPREEIARAFAEHCGVAHGTSTSGHWRIVARPTRIILASEYSRVWRAFAIAAERAGIGLDYSAADASRQWAVPSIPCAGGLYEFVPLEGALFDVDEALALVPPPAPYEPAAREVAGADLSKRIERARRYAATCDPAISGAGGHAATFRVALAVTRGFDLGEEDALEILAEFNLRCQPPWNRFELRHKVRSALQRGRCEPGWLANARRSA